jgi:AraC family transcriptional regulator, regulatory protein of adaptative response / methylated-DNA-[protein]-cysteine methyltransferase
MNFQQLHSVEMKEQQRIDYHRIAEAIGYIKDHFRSQPSLEAIAAKVHLSPFHFQRLFIEWAGVSPKKFIQYLSLDYAKKILADKSTNVSDATFETGLSSTSRLHHLFISIEGMTPAEYRDGGEDLHINYSFTGSRFGELLVASTHKGICYMAFAEGRQTALSELLLLFPKATFSEATDALQENALQVFKDDWNDRDRIKLHLKATPFQLKVWETLLRIPQGRLTTYGDVAAYISKPGASRAVGSAVGDNPVAFLIPCHRVIRSNGVIGEYHWGSARKMAMIGWEASRPQALAL